MDKDKKWQEFLKKLFRWERVEYKIMIVLLWVATIFFLVNTIEYGYKELCGIPTNNMFSNCLTGFLFFGGILVLLFICNKLIIWKNKKELNFDVTSSKKPELRTVDIEDALHHLSKNSSGVIVWDTLFITFFLFFLAVLIWNTIEKVFNIPSIVCTVVSFILLIAGHMIGTKLWKKKPFKEKLLANTNSYMEIVSEERYIDDLNRDLRKKILYYSKEWILTENYFIGKTSYDIGFVPVAIPKDFIEKIAFYKVQSVMSRYRKMPMGYLKCRLYNGKEISFYIGTGARYFRVFRVLQYYGIPFVEDETVYE